MFEVGWSEMLVIAIVMIVVVGPKDLPKMLRTFGRTVGKLRSMAGDFQRQFNDALREAELDDVKKSVDSLRSLNPMTEVRKQLNPFEQAAADVRSGVDQAMKPKTDAPAATPTADTGAPAADSVHPAEPLKNGPAAMPGLDGPAAMPPAPVFPAAAGSTEGPKPKRAGGRTAAAKTANGHSAKPAARAKPKPAASAAVKAVAGRSTAAKPAAEKPRTTRKKPAGVTK